MPTFTISATEQDIQRIDKAANKAGTSRSAYILSWLPETNEQISLAGTDTNGNRARKRQARERSSPAQ